MVAYAHIKDLRLQFSCLWFLNNLVDLNECDRQNGGCEFECLNTVGSFQCTSPEYEYEDYVDYDIIDEPLCKPPCQSRGMGITLIHVWYTVMHINMITLIQCL